jgi:dTDP-4-dehydrorhamnose 3,5-epimerase
MKDYWYPEFERCPLWNDLQPGLNWPVAGEPQLAAKDAACTTLDQAEAFS